jgi:hypothetical protein
MLCLLQMIPEGVFSAAGAHPTFAGVVEELLDAHLDTLELALVMPDPCREWAHHIDYIRTLRRRTEELLAQLSEAHA